ncbi:MAG: endonuclease [Oscillospiraceae bacterium]|nr:endonuclease [Oscillospiraceae bacterium]MCI9549922.1 endonuclease [Oscillospiraceae bacterium]
MAKKALKWAGIVLAAIVLAAAGLVAWLTLTEYKPDAVEELEVGTGLSPAHMYTWKTLTVGDSLTLVSQNTGYAGLGKEADFFMDGGKDVAPTREQVVTYENGIVQQLQAQDADVYFLQEVDTDSSRTGGSDQAVWYHGILNDGELGPYCWMYALNYSCDFVPYPLPPIGKVHSGLQTLSRFNVDSAQRVALPCPFSWPVSTANLKRCLLVSRAPLEGSDKELVLVNLHLEAYDDGEGKAAQTQMLMDLLTREYEKGNYVIAGGDFNQTFPGALDAFPIRDPSLWTPGVLEEDILPDGWRFACDLSVPSCRLLDRPYDPANSQFYVIDGFILSPNVGLDSVETLDEQFQYTDHNPVRIQVTLEP